MADEGGRPRLLRPALARAAWQPRLVAAVAVAAALVIGIRWGTFVASGSDAYGYISQADLWLRGELATLAPDWVGDATWNEARWTSAPLGYRPGEVFPSLVPTYAPGLPLAMAAFQAVLGPNGVYYVVPLLGAVAVGSAYLLGAWLGGAWTGAMAALLMVSSPAFLFMLVQPMSDVPVAGLWGLALWLALRAGSRAAAFAGLIAGAAILTRPNLAPLCLVVGAIALLKPGGRARDALVLGCAAAPAVLFMAWLNTTLHGSALQSGYGGLADIYAADRVLTNTGRYLGWLVDSQTPLIALVALVPLVVRGAPRHRALAALLAIGFPVAVLGLYLPYMTFEEWWYLRFLLPAYPPLLAGVAAVLFACSARLPAAWRTIAIAGVMLLAIVHGARYADPFAVATGETRYLRVVDYVRTLPERSVFVSLAYSGSIKYYTGRDILRWELFFDPRDLDRALEYLQGLGYDLYLVADPIEATSFLDRFRDSAAVSALHPGSVVDLGGALVYPLRVTRTAPVQQAGAP